MRAAFAYRLVNELKSTVKRNTGWARASKVICEVHQRPCNWGARKPTLEGGILPSSSQVADREPPLFYRKRRSFLYTASRLLGRVRAWGLTHGKKRLISTTGSLWASSDATFSHFEIISLCGMCKSSVACRGAVIRRKVCRWFLHR